MYRSFPRPSHEAMLEGSVKTIVDMAFRDASQPSDDQKISELQMEAATSVLLEDYYRNRRKDVLAEMGLDEKEADVFVEMIRKMFL